MATLWGGRQGVRWVEEEGGRAPREGGGAVDAGEQGRRGGDDDGEAVRHVEEEGMGAPGRTMATVGKEEMGRRRCGAQGCLRWRRRTAGRHPQGCRRLRGVDGGAVMRASRSAERRGRWRRRTPCEGTGKGQFGRARGRIVR